MNIRKNIDYSEMYAGIDQVIAADHSQMGLYLALGKLINGRPEKGAAVMAAEYITASYPDPTGFSPRNLRRMRDIYRMYGEYPEMLEQVAKVGWIQNLAIMEAALDMNARYWYLLAVQRFGWSKAELTKQIAADAHLNTIIGDEAQDSKNSSTPGKSSTVGKTILQIIVHTVAFFDGLWYNVFWKIYIF